MVKVHLKNGSGGGNGLVQVVDGQVLGKETTGADKKTRSADFQNLSILDIYFTLPDGRGGRGQSEQ